MGQTQLTADQLGIEAVSIYEEGIGQETGGHFRAEGLECVVPATVGDHDFDFTWDTPRALLSAEVDIHSDWVGDKVSLMVAPDTAIGTLTASSAAGATVHDVSQTVIDVLENDPDNLRAGLHYHIGYKVKINGESLGEVVDVDADNLQITTSAGLAATANTASLVQITVCMANEVPMTSAVAKVIGESKIGGSRIEAGTVVRVRYHNVNGTGKTFAMTMETLY